MKEPTNRDILFEIIKSHILTFLVFSASWALAGFGVMLSSTWLEPANVFGTVIMVMGVIGFGYVSIRGYRIIHKMEQIQSSDEKTEEGDDA